MKQTKNIVTLADIEIEARHLQAQAAAAMFRSLVHRIRAMFAGAPVNTGTGRTA
jgi:hypothetical protein